MMKSKTRIEREPKRSNQRYETRKALQIRVQQAIESAQLEYLKTAQLPESRRKQTIHFLFENRFLTHLEMSYSRILAYSKLK